MNKQIGTWLLFGLLWALFLAPAASFAHDVKDPVCRMTVDSDTTRYKHKLGNKTFYFCSSQCVEFFKKDPEKYVKIAEQLENMIEREYKVLLSASPAVPKPHEPVELTFDIRYADDDTQVTEFETIHEKLFHLLFTSGDLAWFEHQHPVRGADGKFRITWKFPKPGLYRLYADFTPSDGDNQVIMVPLTVGGTPREHPLKAETKLRKRIGDLIVELRVSPSKVLMERPNILTYSIFDLQGRPIRNMQPFIGAMGHLIAISQDGEQVVHTHTIYPQETSGMDGHASIPAEMRVTPQMATEKGPSFSFKLTTPTSGLYKTWAQFMYQNKVVTVPFVFNVEDLWETAKAANPSQAMKATIQIDGGYSPARVVAKVGQPVELTFVRSKEDGCGGTILFKSLGIKKEVDHGKSVTIRFVPQKAGKIEFTCGMEMYEGVVEVVP